MADNSLKFAEGFAGGTYTEWKYLVEKTLKGKPFDKAMRKKTYDGVEYEALSTAETAIIESQPTRSHGDWAIVSPHWLNDAQQVNADALEDLSRGASAIAVSIDESGQHGIPGADLKTAFSDVYLNMVPFTLIQGVNFEPAINALESILIERSYNPADIHGLLGVDPIGALARYGYAEQPVEEVITTAALIAANVAENWPHVSTFVADGTVYANAGAGEAQEVSACLSVALTYLRAMETAGLPLDKAAQQIQFTMSAGTNLWHTLAKFRTIRRLWQQVLTASGVTGVTAKVNAVLAVNQISMKDPWVNILRGTAGSFGAVVGGADAVTVLPHDLMLGTVNKFSRKIARNIQIILQEESNLAKVSDPAAGSYALETLTANMTTDAWGLIQEIESANGILSELRSGALVERINKTKNKRSEAIRKRKYALTGVSEFPNIDEPSIAGMLNHPITETNTATHAEHVTPLVLARLAWDFEKLRFQSDEIEIKSGNRPSVFLANIGTPADYTARATFAKNFFEAGGVKAVSGEGQCDAHALANEFIATGTKSAILCGTDTQYEEIAEDVIGALKAKGCGRIYIAGKITETAHLTEAGLDEMVYLGADVIEILQKHYEMLGDGLTKSGDES